MADIYDGTIRFDYHDPDHTYTIQHKVGNRWSTKRPVQGVTSALSIISKDFLAPWAAKLTAEYMKEETKKALALGKKPAFTRMVKEAKAQHVIAKHKGAQSGTVGHALVEALILGNKVVMPSDPDDLAVAESVKAAYEMFIDDYQPTFLQTEVGVYSKTHDYAGTFDALANLNGKKVLLDWKTTNSSRINPEGIYPSYFAQLGAYALAYEEMTGETVDDMAIVNLPKNGEEYKFKALSDIGLTKTEAICYFLAAKSLFDINKQFEWRMSNHD